MTTLSNKRYKQLDMLKGFAAIMVAIGHLAFMADAHRLYYRWIFQYHMPVFFWCAGFCFSVREGETPFVPYLWKKVKRLLVPGWLFRTATAAIFVYRQASQGATISFLQTLPSYLYHYSVEWFLPSLFLGYMALYVFYRLYKRIGMLSVVPACVLVAFVPFLCAQYDAVIGRETLYLPFLPDSTLIGFSIMQIGFLSRRALPHIQQYLAERKPLLKTAGFRLGLAGLVIIVLLLWYRYTSRPEYPYVNIAHGAFGESDLLYFFFAVFWVLGLTGVFTWMMRTRGFKTVSNMLALGGGTYSLPIYLLHIVVNDVWAEIFVRITQRAWNYWEYSVPVRLVYCAANLAAVFLLIFLWNRIKKGIREGIGHGRISRTADRRQQRDRQSNG